jgi:hypothetical protein
LLLRFDPGPRHYVIAFLALITFLAGGAYWMGFIPLGGYNQLGFLVPGDGEETRVNATPLPAVSRGEFGVGGLAAVPNTIRTYPADRAQGVSIDTALSARFDQPMDRRSVERGLSVEPPLSGEFSWGADNEVRFTPEQPMLLGVAYTVTLTGTARSLHGIPLSEPVRWSFHTRDPYKVTIAPETGARLQPTSSFTLAFETPMQPEGVQVGLRSPSSPDSLPATLTWDESGENLTIAPKGPLPVGDVYLWVGADSTTHSGDKLGQAYEAVYKVEMPLPRLRLAGGRVRVLPGQARQHLQYEALANATGALPSSLTLDVYALPIEKLAAWGVQSRERAWPAPLPVDAREGLVLVKTLHQAYDDLRGSGGRIELPLLAPGAYLVSATAPSAGGMLRDWQTLLVADGTLALVNNQALWATNKEGHAWAGSEILLFGPDGALLNRGQADEQGLWTPEGSPTGATLGIARDSVGGLAATLWEPAIPALAPPSGKLDATLLTDRPGYGPGQIVNFRAQLRLPTPAPASVPPPSGGAAPTPARGRDILVTLLHPNGAPLTTLELTTDEVGGAVGSIALPRSAQDAEYTIRVQSDGEHKDFPVSVEVPRPDTLSVYVVPALPEVAGTERITRMVSVLGPEGEPVTAALVTATLGISGDNWISEPVTATTDGAGRATFVATLPKWATRNADPALLMTTEVRSGEHYGRHSQYLDLSNLESLQANVRHLVSPSLDLRAVARVMEDGGIEISLSRLDVEGGPGEALIIAQSQAGETAYRLLDPAAATPLVLPEKFRGGRLLLKRAGREGTRDMPLPLGLSADLSLSVVSDLEPGAPVSVTLSLASDATSYSPGVATIWFRRLGGASLGLESYDWVSDFEMSPTGITTGTVTVPGEPGLWYVMVEVARVDGKRALTQQLVRVLPGIGIQVPPPLASRVGELNRAVIVVHNAGKKTLSSGLRVEGDPDLRVSGGGSQAIDVASGAWQRLEWHYTPQQAGAAGMTFAFMPSAHIGGSWRLSVTANESDRASVTHFAGATTNLQRVGVQVPSGLSTEGVRLEVRTSTNLLPALASIATGPLGNGGDETEERARPASLASVSEAYKRTGFVPPDTLEMDPLQRATLLDMLYGTQQPDGGWGNMGGSVSSITTTAGVLLSLKREALAEGVPGRQSAITAQPEVIRRGLDFLSREALRPPQETTEALDARAYTFYALAVYGELGPGIARPYLRYSAAGLGTEGLSRTGQAWLALALHYSGDRIGARMLLHRLLNEGAREAGEATPMLELLVLAGEVPAEAEAKADRQGDDEPDYLEAAQSYVRLLMAGRRGSGWGNSRDTADALWALSRYAIRNGEKAQPTTPNLTLNGRNVEGKPGPARGTVQIALAGDVLAAGTNWLELRPAVPGQTLYYSLTLRATP